MKRAKIMQIMLKPIPKKGDIEKLVMGMLQIPINKDIQKKIKFYLLPRNFVLLYFTSCKSY